MRRTELLALALALALSPGCGDEDAAVDLQQEVASIVSGYVDTAAALTDQTKTPGVVVAALHGARSGVFGFGATRVSGGRTPDGDTLFQIGSVSKALTGLVLARELIGSKQVKATDLVETHLPALKGSNGTKGVTLELLASHHSGLVSMPTNLPKKDPLSPAEGYALPALKAYLTGLKTPVQPDKAYRYSNLGIGLLSLALEKKLGASGYHGLLQATLVKDLGLTDIWGQVASIPAAAQGRAATGYAL